MAVPANLNAWNTNAAFWDDTLGDTGNDLFQQLILPTFDDLVGNNLKEGDRILDLGTGNGMIARALARQGVYVLGTDYSSVHLDRASIRANQAGKVVSFRKLDLLNNAELESFAQEHREEEKRFDVVTGSMLLKELSTLEPLASFLPKVMKANSRAVFVNPHPCFQKPAAHRVMEVLENPETGMQEQRHWIKVSRYLHVRSAQSQALRGQAEPLLWHHHTIQDLLNPFTAAGLRLHEIQEPSFSDGKNPEEIQNYHNYPEIPMLFNFLLVKSPWGV